MATYSVGEFLEDDSIVLEDIPSKKHPKGKAYRFASPDFETGLWLKNLIEFGQRVALGGEVRDSDSERLNLDDDEEVDLYRRVMGETFQQLRDDGVSWGHTQKVFQLLLKHWGTGQDVAASLREAAAESGEAAAQPNRSARRASARSSSPTAGSKSSRASSATKGRTAARASTRSSATSASGKPRRAS